MRECITTVVFVFSAAACASVQQRLGERLGLKEGSLTKQCADEGLRIDLLGACTPLCFDMGVGPSRDDRSTQLPLSRSAEFRCILHTLRVFARFVSLFFSTNTCNCECLALRLLPLVVAELCVQMRR